MTNVRPRAAPMRWTLGPRVQTHRGIGSTLAAGIFGDGERSRSAWASSHRIAAFS